MSLESEYAKASRSFINAYEVVQNVDEEICAFIKQSITAHDRKIMAKQLPDSLFAGDLPSSFKRLTG